MSRRWLRLVSCMSLVAYLLSNTHLHLAFAGCTHSSCAAKTAEKPTEKSKPVTTKCKHCAKQQQPTSEKGQTKDHDPNCPGCPDCPFGPSCPCCPNGNHPCPVPGGCAMCSVAKAPCLTVALSCDPFLGATFDTVPEVSISYVPPSSDGMIRPPKA